MTKAKQTYPHPRPDHPLLSVAQWPSHLSPIAPSMGRDIADFGIGH